MHKNNGPLSNTSHSRITKLFWIVLALNILLHTDFIETWALNLYTDSQSTLTSQQKCSSHHQFIADRPEDHKITAWSFEVGFTHQPNQLQTANRIEGFLNFNQLNSAQLISFTRTILTVFDPCQVSGLSPPLFA